MKKIFTVLLCAVSYLSSAQVAGISGVVSQYKFSGNANDNIGVNNGTVTGATLTADRFGVSNSAYNFNSASSNYIQLPFSAFNLVNYTYSAWVNFTTLPASGGCMEIIGIGGGGGDQNFTCYNNVYSSGDNTTYTGFTASGYCTPSTVAGAQKHTLPSTGAWYHVVATRDSNKYRLYINGALIETSPSMPGTYYGTTNQRSIIGARSNISSNFFNGKIDDIVIFNRAISSNDVATLYNSQQTQTSAYCIVSSYPFTGNANDNSGLNNGTIHGATLTTDRFGHTNSAYNFASANSNYIEVPFSPFNLSNYTYSAWVNLASLPANGGFMDIIGIGGGGGDQNFGCYNNVYSAGDNTTYNGLTSSGYCTSSTVAGAQQNALPSLNTWYHMVGTKDNNYYKLYINGVLVNTSVSTPGAYYGTSNQKAIIGARSTTGNNFNGKIDDVKIFGCALNASQIDSIWNAERPQQTITQNISICAGNSINVGSHTHSVAGTYTDTLHALGGADSIVITNLSVNPTYNINNPVTINSGDSYVINGHSYSVAGSYSDSLSSISGCDSIIVSNITVVIPDTTAGCIISKYLFTGNANDAMSINNGTVVGATLTVDRFGTPNSAYNFSSSSTTYVELPFSSFNLTNYTYSAWVNLASLPSSGGTMEIIGIGGAGGDQNFTCYNGVYSAADNTTYTGFTAGGYCTPSTVAGAQTNALPNINKWYHVVGTRDNNYYKIYVNGVLVSTSASTLGTYYGSSSQTAIIGARSNISNKFNGKIDDVALFGCALSASQVDSIWQAERVLTNQTITICNGDSYTIGSNSYTLPGTYSDTLQGAGGDSLVITNLMVNPTYSINNPVTICALSSYALNGHTYSAAGTYVDSLTSVLGCDSIITTILTTYTSNSASQNISICNGESYTIGISSYNISGTYVDTLQAVAGCDSIVTTTLIVINIDTVSQNISICGGQSFSVGTSVYSYSGTYIDTLQAFTGCDSVVTTVLTVINVDSVSQNISVCNGQSYTIGNSTYNLTGNYINHFTNILGCDSVVTTNLMVLNIDSVTNDVTLCFGDSVIIGSNVYGSTGNYVDHFTNISGCDSVVISNIAVLPLYNTYQNISICIGDSLYTAGAWQTIPGTYINNYLNINGCDSVVNVNLNYSDSNNVVSGNVFINGVAVNNIMIELIKSDSLSLSGYNSVSSAMTDANGFYSFSNVARAEYLIKANTDTSRFPNTVSTYADSMLGWADARVVNLGNMCSDTISGVNINMITLDSLTGSASISGVLTSIVTQKTFSIVPLPEIDVFLQTTNGEAVAMNKTDNNGVFTFANVPQGSYRLYTDLFGFISDSSNPIVIDGSGGSESVVVDLCADSSVGVVASCSVILYSKQIDTKSYINVYPNPTNINEINVIGIEMQSIKIIDVLGKEIKIQSTMINGVVKTDLFDASKGVYFISGRDIKGYPVSQRIIIN